MSQYTTETRIKEGNLKLSNIPIANDTDVKVIIIPKIDLEKLNLNKVSNLLKSITGNLAEDVQKCRD